MGTNTTHTMAGHSIMEKKDLIFEDVEQQALVDNMEVIRVPTFGEGGGDGEEGAAPAADAGKLECGGLHRYIAMAMLCAECLLCTFRLLGAGRAVSILVISHAVGKHPEKKMFGFLGLGAIVFDV